MTNQERNMLRKDLVEKIRNIGCAINCTDDDINAIIDVMLLWCIDLIEQDKQRLIAQMKRDFDDADYGDESDFAD